MWAHTELYFLARSILEAARGAASVFGGGSNVRHALANTLHVQLTRQINPIYGFRINNLSARAPTLQKISRGYAVEQEID